MNLLRISLLSLALAASASAQAVRFRGQVEDVSGTQSQFFVDGTDVRLTSASVSLQAFVGQQVTIEGVWNGSFASPSVAVGALAAASEDFEIGGSAKIGEMGRLHAVGTPGESVVFFGSLEPGFFPLPSAGAVLVDPASAEILGGGTIGGLGQLEVATPIPNDPSLVGLTYRAQALVLDPVGGTFRLTTNDSKEIRS